MLSDISYLGTSTNLLTFNDFDHSPVFHMEQRFATKEEIREFDLPLPEGSGVSDFSTFLGKEYFVFEGVMYPDTDADWQNGRDILSAVGSTDLQQNDPQSDHGYVPYKYGNRQIMVKVVRVTKPENVNIGQAQPFTIFAKVKWPYQTAQAAVTTSLNFTSASTGGASGLPFGLPVALGGGNYNSTATLNNTGNAPAYPSFTLVGPITNPRITNNTTGEFIEVDVTLATGADTLVIKYGPDFVTVTLNGNSVYQNMLSASTLFKIKPGNNTITLTGSSFSLGASCAVSFNPTWPI